MASGRINLQANDGKVAGIVFEDGASGNVAVTVPKDGGKLAADSSVVHKTGNETIAGVKTFSNSVVMNGNVGIGTSSPAGKLHVQNDTGITTTIIGNSTANTQVGVDATGNGYLVSYGAPQVLVGNMNSAGYLSLFSGNAERMRIDTAGNVLVTGSGGLGYGTGSGGTVTQLTSKSTSVTLNKPCGQIIMNNESMAANTYVYFGIYNNTILKSDGVVITQDDSGLYTGANYDIKVVYRADGLIGVVVKNISGTTLSDAVRFRFYVIKGANS